MKRLLLFSIFVISSQSFAEEICARKFDVGGSNPCALDVAGFAYVPTAGDPDVTICTRVYAESYCTDAPEEFQYTKDTEANRVCTVDFHQPPLHQYCDTNPDYFVWVNRSFDDEEFSR